MRILAFTTASLLALSAAAAAQGVLNGTQNRSGLGDADHPTNPSNGLPAGAMNATTGPQAHPAYPSGSDTSNPGAAMVRAASPKPATGPAAKPVGNVSTMTLSGHGAKKQPASAGVGQASTPPK